MDPASVISIVEATGEAITACTTVIKAIIDFIHEVQRADESLNEIKMEVENLDCVLKAIQDSLEQIQSRSTGLNQRQHVLEAVNRSVAGCDSSLKTLFNILGRVRGADGGSGGVIESTQQAIRLRQQRRNFEECRSKIKEYKLNLILSLTIVGWYDFPRIVATSNLSDILAPGSYAPRPLRHRSNQHGRRTILCLS